MADDDDSGKANPALKQLADAIERLLVSSVPPRKLSNSTSDLICHALLGYVREVGDLMESERLVLALNILNEATSTAPITPEALEQAINSKTKAMRSQKDTEYVLVTHLSMTQIPELDTRTIGGCQISFHSDRGSFPITDGLQTLIDRYQKVAEPTGSVVVQVRVKGDTIDRASARALDMLDVYRGILNFFMMYKRLVRNPGPSITNNILVGPIHTLHRTDGTPIENKMWYEREYPIRDKPVNYSPIMTDRSTEIKKSLDVVSKVADSHRLLKALRQYVRALDGEDPNATLMKLWGVLEGLTDTLHRTYDTTIQRTTGLFKEKLLAKLELRYLADCRNSIVHADSSATEGLCAVNRLRYFVDEVLGVYFCNPFDLISPSEVAQYLEMTSNEKTLQRQIELHEFRLREVRQGHV